MPAITAPSSSNRTNFPSPAAGYASSRTVPRPPWNPSTATSRASPVPNASVGIFRATTSTRVPFAVVVFVAPLVWVPTEITAPSTFTTSPSVTRTSVRCTALSALSSRSTTPCSAETRSRVPVTEKPPKSTLAVYSLFPRYARAVGNARVSCAERNAPSRAYATATRAAYAASVSFTRTATPNSAYRSLALPPIRRVPTTTRTASAASTTSPASSAASSARSSARSCSSTVSVAALGSTEASARSTTAST